MNISPNRDKDRLENADIESIDFPYFLHKIKIEKFRHLENLEITFTHPITIINGTNRSGKTSILTAIACSHIDFKLINPSSGNLERVTWRQFMNFTKYDDQLSDWTYYLTHRQGSVFFKDKRGQRKADTKRWNGIAKKESQIDYREVIFIDVSRITPARSVSKSLHHATQRSTPKVISNEANAAISYIFERSYVASALSEFKGKETYSFGGTYSSYNCASGEDVITYILQKVIAAQKKSLILIDELELGLHPKVQRRLIDVINYFSGEKKLQFIITSHSPSVVDSFSKKSRKFLYYRGDDKLRVYEGLSKSATFSFMDAKIHSALEVLCEDEEAAIVIKKAVSMLPDEEFRNLIEVIPVGPASTTYAYFETSVNLSNKQTGNVPVACVLDGDQYSEFSNKSVREGLFFWGSRDEAPEKMLLRSYLSINPNQALFYHLNTSNCHCLTEKMVENNLAQSKSEAFTLLLDSFLNTDEGKSCLYSLMVFINSELQNSF